MLGGMHLLRMDVGVLGNDFALKRLYWAGEQPGLMANFVACGVKLDALALRCLGLA